MNTVSCSALLLSVLMAACANGDGDGSGFPDSGVNSPDADNRPNVDAGPRLVRMFVHTDTTLYLIDDQNFALTEIGPFNAPDGDRMTDLAITPNGEIYTLSNKALYHVNRDTAQATLIGPVAGTANVGMTFLVDGTLLATDKTGGVRKIDPETGAVTELGEFGSGYATAGDLVAVADGRMFAISDKGPMGNEADNNVLITIDPETGAFVQSIGQIGWGRVFGSAVANNRVYAFTDEGYVVEINPVNGVGTQRAYYESIKFWGAGVTPTAAID